MLAPARTEHVINNLRCEFDAQRVAAVRKLTSGPIPFLTGESHLSPKRGDAFARQFSQ